MAAVAMETAALPTVPEAQVGDHSLDVVSDPHSTLTLINPVCMRLRHTKVDCERKASSQLIISKR